MHRTPYSVVREGGVTNKHVTSSPSDATLHQLYLNHKKPVELPVSVDEYHAMPKAKRSRLKMSLPYFVGAVMDPPQRRDDNVTQRTLITLDIEQTDAAPENPPSPENVADKLRELGGEGWVYTSISHTPEQPRYRVVLPLGKFIEGANATATLKATTHHAARKLGIEEWLDEKSWTLSQPMYMPSKLEGSEFKQWYVKGKAWAPQQAKAKQSTPADIPDERPDFVLQAVKRAGLYLRENPAHKGMHFITCPFSELHTTTSETKTAYYEAHFDGNPRPAVKCMGTGPDSHGHAHLTYTSLVRWLKDNGHLTPDQQAEAGVLDDFESFDNKADISVLLDAPYEERDWAISRFAPVGKVTVVGGPGGVSKSMLLMHVLVHAAMGETWHEFQPRKPLRSLFVSYEDDNNDLRGRLMDITGALASTDNGTFDMLHDVNGTVRKNLFVYSADDEPTAWLLLTKPDRFGTPERTQRVQWLVDWIKSRSVRMLVLDPAVYTHQLEENDIADMAQYMQTLGYIAKHAHCAVVVLHHMNKAGAWAQLDDINQSSLRGASSFADNARSVVAMVSMPVKDAPAYGLPADHETLSKYVVCKHVKHNYSAPMPTQIFERRGRLLIPRPDIVRLDGVQLVEAREQLKQDEVLKRVQAWSVRVLGTLADHDGPVSQNQVSAALNAKPALMKQVLEWCSEQDYVDISDGPNRSRLHELTAVGKRYLKQQTKGAK
jgi:AAA domain